VASVPQHEVNIVTPNLGTIPLPESHYQAVKRHVNTSVANISKKIAPVIAYVESPAFAAELPQSPNTNSDESAVRKTAAENPAKISQSNEAASPSREPATISTTISSGTTRNSSSGSTKVTIAKSQPRLTELGLDNAYALKVRKRLVVDENYRSQLRQNGVNIDFGDGFKFESKEKNIQYIEKNGVLVRRK
jgi:hypothetical protein